MREQGCLLPRDMSAQVTQVTRFHQLADAEDLLGNERGAHLYRNAAVRYGVCILTLTERDREKKKDLNEALEWLRSRDYEMHKAVNGTLEQARAVIVLAKKATNVRRIYGNQKRRAA